MRPRTAALVAGVVGGAALCVAPDARAQDCTSLPNRLVVQAGDTQEPLLKKLGKKLKENTANPIDLVYLTAGSCTNIEAFYTGAKITVNAKYIPDDFDTSMPAPSCTVDPQNGLDIDVAVSALFVSACNPNPPPDGIALFQGPVQPYVFVVPEGSTQTAITAEEAYFAFGFGASGHADPWVDESFFFIRPVTKSTLLTLAAHIDVPGAKWKGVPLDKSSEVVNAVAGVAAESAEKTIGILGAEVYDANRETLDALAFRAFGQRYAYYPDSTPEVADKRNVRHGQYLPWSPTVYLAHVDEQGQPTNAKAKYLVDAVLGHELDPAPSFNPLETVLDVKLVPDCAMHVTRSREGGPLSSYLPDEPCHCLFEEVVAGGTPCATCEDTVDCNAGVCRNGFCEAY